VNAAGTTRGPRPVVVDGVLPLRTGQRLPTVQLRDPVSFGGVEAMLAPAIEAATLTWRRRRARRDVPVFEGRVAGRGRIRVGWLATTTNLFGTHRALYPAAPFHTTSSCAPRTLRNSESNIVEHPSSRCSIRTRTRSRRHAQLVRTALRLTRSTPPMQHRFRYGDGFTNLQDTSPEESVIRCPGSGFLSAFRILAAIRERSARRQ